MTFDSLSIVVGALVVTSCATVLGALVRRGQETGFPVYRALPGVLAALGAAAAGAFVASNTNLGLAALAIAAIIAMGALGTWLVQQEWDPTHMVAMQCGAFALFLMAVGGHQPLAMVMAAVLMAFVGAVFAPLPAHARSMQTDGGAV